MVLLALQRLKKFPASSDNFIFRLCYRWTVLLLLAFSFVVTCRLLFGDSFDCVVRSDHNEPTKYGISRCYSSGTGRSYYRWVNLFFLVQAIVFCLPHLLWRSYEKGYLRRVTSGVRTYFDRDDERGPEIYHLAKYVLMTRGKHKFYASVYVLLETCNFAVSLSQIFCLKYFFGVTAAHGETTMLDFEKLYFPAATTCSVTFPELSCALPLNSLYMNMYIFLYGWYIFLTVLCGLVVIYRLAHLHPFCRVFVITLGSSRFLAEDYILTSFCLRMGYADWFFLTRLQKTMMDVDFTHMIDEIANFSQGKIKKKDTERARLIPLDDDVEVLDNFNETTTL